MNRRRLGWLSILLFSLVVGVVGQVAACNPNTTSAPKSAEQPEASLHIPVIPASAHKNAQTATSASPTNPASKMALRAKPLFDHPEWLGALLTVEIYEPLYDAAHSTAADEGEYDVSVSDVGPKRLKITPGASSEENAAGALVKLPPDLVPPIRVRGVLAKSSSASFSIIAHDIEKLSFPKPTHLTSAKELTDEPKNWSGRFVELEDTLTTGFEIAVLGKTGVWLDSYPSVIVRCEPPRTNANHFQTTTRRVRVIGYAYTEGRYGHLSMSSATVVATELVYLDPKQPNCR